MLESRHIPGSVHVMSFVFDFFVPPPPSSKHRRYGERETNFAVGRRELLGSGN